MVLSDRVLTDVTYSHVGSNFILDHHEPSLSTVQPFLIVSTGINGRRRRTTQSVIVPSTP